jgi:ABC-2 type transport system ATP-binding protein
MSAPLLEARGLARTYGSVRAVSDLSFSLERGQVFGFIGPNGAGKTTTMRILSTLDLPDEGDALVDGRSVLVEPRAVRRLVGFMADLFVPYANLDVRQMLDFSARAQGLRGRERVRAVRSVASFCGLLEFYDRPTTGLSKGMGQRLHLAKTLLHDPSLLILDEPTAGLDPRARIEFRDLVGALAAAGKGILISSHILSELSESCDGVVVIERGRKVVSGSIEEIARGLGPRRAVTLRTAGAPEDALAFFLVQPDVHAATADGRGVRFEIDGDDGALADLVARAVAGGLRVCEVRFEEAGLEEIFLRTTKGRLQ